MNNDWLDIEILEDYLDGKLDAKTMHRVEREALEDPFVAEALAGLSAAPKRAHSLSLLQKQLSERIAEQQHIKKKSVITWQRLSIAATAAVLFIAVSIVFWMKETNYQKQLAGQAKKVEVELAPKPAEGAVAPSPELAKVAPAADAVSSEKKTAETKPSKEIDQAIAAVKTEAYAANLRKAVPMASKVAAAPLALVKQSSPLLDEVAVTAMQPERKMSMTGAVTTVADPAHVIRGKVLSTDNKQPIVGVSVRVKGTNLRGVTDTNGEFNIQVDSLMKEGALVANSIGYKTTELNARVNEPVSLSLVPSDQSLNEVVLTAYGRKKSKTMPVSANPAPIGGWDQFNNYLKKNNRFSKDAPLNQEIVLGFKVDQKGRPASIKVISGHTDKYEKEAIRLLQKGPKWERPEEEGKQIEVTITF